MRPHFLLLGVLGLQVAAQDEGLTIDIVSSQINDFLQSIRNGTLDARDASSKLPSTCALACSFLNFAQPGQVSYPESPVYESQEVGYFSEFQSTQEPTCRFAPVSTLGVSLAVLTVQVTQCKFAVRSGGHGYFAGASNIDGGLTIDLRKLKTITISSDKTQTSIGTGNKWLDVYNVLEPKGLSVIGGRVADIGTGGLTLGGGISFFSARYGWACDNVNNYQVVFADGSIRDVSYSTYPDLYFALRGGGNNFGIVTRLDLVTFPQGDLWAGSYTYLYSKETATALAEAIYWVNVNTPSDPFAQTILPFAYVQSLGTWVLAPEIQYGKPIAQPPILSNFTSIPGSLATNERVTKLTAETVALNASSPSGFRQSWWAMAVKNSPTIITTIMDIAMEETKPIQNFTDMVPAVVVQPISASMISHFSKNGGNALGITPADGPLLLVDIALMWSSASDDEAVFEAAARFIDRVNATAYAQGLGHPFIYQNYAAVQQPVFQGYGQKNLAKLRAVSKKYDPQGVWQKLQPGYFKIF